MVSSAFEVTSTNKKTARTSVRVCFGSATEETRIPPGASTDIARTQRSPPTVSMMMSMFAVASSTVVVDVSRSSDAPSRPAYASAAPRSAATTWASREPRELDGVSADVASRTKHQDSLAEADARDVDDHLERRHGDDGNPRTMEVIERGWLVRDHRGTHRSVLGIGTRKAFVRNSEHLLPDLEVVDVITDLDHDT